MHGGGEAAITGAVLSESQPAEELAPEVIANAEGDHALIVNGLLAMGCDIADCREAATQTKNAGVTEAGSRVLHNYDRCVRRISALRMAAYGCVLHLNPN